MGWLEKLINFAKQKPIIVFWFFICSTILLFTPNYYLRIIHLDALANNIAPVAGFIFLLSGVLASIHIFNSGRQYFLKRRDLNQKRHILGQLEKLYGINEVKSGFKSQQDCISWSNKIAPLLKFNDQYYMNFLESSSLLNIRNISGNLAASLLSTMVSQVEMAIEELRKDLGKSDSK
jgi:hypothetical protein